MGVDTKGVLVSPCKDVFVITGLAVKALDRLIRNEIVTKFGSVRFWNEEVRKEFSTVESIIRHESDMVQLHFKFLGEQRSISVFFTCDGDHEDLGPKSISFSMSHWGRSELFAQTILHALSLIGPTYFDANDCDSIDLAPAKAFRPTLLQAVKLGYVRSTAFEDFVEFFKESSAFPDKSSKALAAFTGLSATALNKLMALEYQERWDQLNALAKKTPTPALDFWTEFQEEMMGKESAAAKELAVA